MARRGTEENPVNRFERIALEPDPEAAADPDAAPAPATRFFADPTRAILSHNDSPDVGFDTSVNPYRGCEHGCVYCLAPETPVLHSDMSWRPLGEVRVGDEIVGFDEHPPPGGERKLRAAAVQAVWWSRKPTLRVVTRNSDVVTTAEHRWLHTDGAWSRADELEPGHSVQRAPLAGEVVVHEPLAQSGQPVDAIEPGPIRDVVDIQTSTGTFFAAGLATHNCYARPFHEYLGFSAGLDFETRILVKRDAPALLRKALAAPGWRPQVIALSGVTDAYQPVERKLRITRGCLEVLAEFRNPVAIVTKSRLVARDADLLAELARAGAASIHVSVTTLEPALQRTMEPRASAPRERLRAIEALAGAGVPVGVMIGPVIPGLTDHELPAILAAASGAGAGFASHIVLRLPHGVAALFEAWLERHFPDRKAKVLNRIRAVRGGRTNDARYGSRMRGAGPWAEQIHALFELGRRRAGLAPRGPILSTAAFRRPGGTQIDLF
jgi:DNA repair photolyase